VGSIVAFCRRLGLKGFADFKNCLGPRFGAIGPARGRCATTGIDLRRSFKVHAQSLVETLKINPEATFEACCPNHRKAARSNCSPIGLSYSRGLYGLFVNFSSRPAAATQFDSQHPINCRHPLKAGDVGVWYLLCGTTARPCNAWKWAKSKGATRSA